MICNRRLYDFSKLVVIIKQSVMQSVYLCNRCLDMCNSAYKIIRALPDKGVQRERLPLGERRTYDIIPEVAEE